MTIEVIDVTLDDGVSANAAKIVEGLNRVGKAADVVVENVRKVGPSLSSINKATDENAAFAAKSEAANRKLAASLETLRQGVSAGKVTTEQATLSEQRLNTIRDKSVETAGRQRDAMREMFTAAKNAGTATDALTAAQGTAGSATDAATARINAQTAALDKAAKYQDALNKALGTAAPNDYAKRALDIAAYGDEMNRLQAKYDPLFAASHRYATALDEINQAQKIGALTAEQAGAALNNQKNALESSKKALEEHGVSSKLASYEMKQFGIQGIQAFSGIATGQPILTTLIQQGHQIVDSLLASGNAFGILEAIGKKVWAAITNPVGLVIVAIVAVGTAIYSTISSSEKAISRMLDLQNTLRATRSDYVNLSKDAEAAAKALYATSAISLPDARSVTATLAASANFSGGKDALLEYGRIAENLAKQLGITVPNAAKELAAILDGPSAAAYKFAAANQFGFNLAIADHIKMLETQGRAQQGANEVLNQVAEATSKTTENVSRLSKAWESFKQLFVSPAATAGSLFQAIGTGITDVVSLVLESVTLMVNKISEIGSGIKKLLDDFVAQVTGNVVFKFMFGGTMPQPVAAPAMQPVPANGSAPPASAFSAYSSNQALAAQTSAGRVVLGDHVQSQGGGQAIGAFQVMPQTAVGLKYQGQAFNPYDSAGNVGAGLTYIQQLYGNKRLTTEDQRARAYTTGPAGNLNSDAANKYGAKFAAAAPITGGVAGLIDFWAPILGLTAEQVVFGKRIAQVEHPGGSQFAASGVPNPGPSPGLITGQNDNAQKLYESANTLPRQLEINKAEQDGLKLAIENAKAAGNAEQVKNYSDALAVATSKASELITEQRKLARASEDGLNPLKAEAGAARDLATIRQHATEVARSTSAGVRDETALNVELANKRKELIVTYEDGLRKTNEATVGILSINAAYKDGVSSVIEATNRAQAQTQALATSERGTAEYTRQITLTTEALNAQSRAKADNATLAQSFGQNNELESLKLQETLIGATNDEQTKALSLLKERQRIIQSGGSIETAASQASLARIGQIDDETAALNRQRNGLAELGSFADNTFATIGNAITSAFATGNLKALDFKALMKSVLSSIIQEFAKLAILNPLKNLFGGQQSPTLTDVGSSLSKFLGGGNSTTSAGTTGGTAGSSTGGIGGIDTLLSKLGGLFGGSSSDALSSSSPTNIALNQLGGQGGKAFFGPAAPDAVTAIQTSQTGASSGGISGALSSIGSLFSSGSSAVSTATTAAGTATTAATTAASTAGSALSTISAAVPYVSAAIAAFSIAKQFSSGDTSGGTKSLLLGSLVSSFFPSHPKNPYSLTNVNVADGQLQTGQTFAQKIDPNVTKAPVDAFVKEVNDYLTSAKLVIANANGRIGVIGDANSKETKNPADLFKTLTFASNGGANPDSNLGIAQTGSLAGQSFNDPAALQNMLVKISTFTDALDALGVHLDTVGANLTNITVASVKAKNQNGDAIMPDISGTPPDMLHTALSNGLVGKSFANADALMAEVAKIDTLVNTTMPTLLNPIFDTSSALMTQLGAVCRQYDDAIALAKTYGLATDDLTKAQQKAVDILRKPALDALAASNNGIAFRGATARGEDTSALQATAFDQQSSTQRDALKKQYTDIYGTVGMSQVQGQYEADLKALNSTLAAEKLSLERKNAAAALAVEQASADNQANIRARVAAAQGDTITADLINQDTKAKQETRGFTASYSANADYQQRLTQLEQAQQADRLAIIQKYADAAVQTSSTAATAAGAIITGQTGGGSASSAQTAAKASLAAFDMASFKSRVDLYDSLRKTFGWTAEFGNQLAAYDKSLAAQRLTIEQQYGAQVLAVQKQVLANNLGLQVRALTALGDVAGSAALQAKTSNATARDAVVAEGGDVALFDLTVALENATVTQKTATDALSKQATFISNNMAALKSNTDALKAAADGLRKYSLSLNTSAQSPLTPAQQLAAARAAMASDLATINDKSKDATTRANAGSQLQTDAGTRLTIAENYYGKSTKGYAGEFSSTQGSLDGAANTLASVASVGERSLLVLQAQLQLTQAYSDLSASIGTGQYDANKAAVAVAKTNLTQAVALSDNQISAGADATAATLKTTLDAADAQRNAILSGTTTDLTVGLAQIDAINNLAAAMDKASADQSGLQEALRAQVATSQKASAAEAAQVRAQADKAAAAAKASADALLAQQQQAATDAANFATQQIFVAKQKDAITNYFVHHDNMPQLAPDSTNPTQLELQQVSMALNIQEAALYNLGREFSTSDLDKIITSFLTGVSNLNNLNSYLPGTAEAKAYRMSAGLVNGGSVGNGIYNQDSVVAAYAGGGNIALAGGEYVVNARQAAQYASILPSINKGNFSPSAPANSNSAAEALQAIRAELAGLRAQVAKHTAITAQGAVEVRDAVKGGHDIARRTLSATKLAVR